MFQAKLKPERQKQVCEMLRLYLSSSVSQHS